MAKNLIPLYDRILVQRMAEPPKEEGELELPDSAKEKPVEGFVVSAGDGRITEDGRVIPLRLKGGETILFGKYAGSEIKLNGEEYLILREEEVLGILTD